MENKGMVTKLIIISLLSYLLMGGREVDVCIIRRH
jgi:hypothetical protein